jgi:hypothetical protein
MALNFIRNLKEILNLGFLHSNVFVQELWLLSVTHFLTQADHKSKKKKEKKKN